MPSINEMIDDLLVREGGYVNDPDDPGGATNFGITIHTLSAVRGRRVSAAEVRALSRSEAKEIYRARYYHHPKIDQLPEALQASVFDMYVNAGNRSVKILQFTLNEFGHHLAEDGAIGPQTTAAARHTYERAEQLLVDAYGIERRNYYYNLADRRVSSRKYARSRSGGKGGWIKRAEEFISPQYHLSNEEHAARTAAWR